MIKWTPELSVGIEELDQQNQEMFSAMQDLMEAMNQGLGQTVIEKTLSFLTDYVQRHTVLEEQYLEQRDYLDLPEHRYQHRTLMQRGDELCRAFKAEGPSSHLTIKLQLHLTKWLHHILRVDQMAFK